MLGSLKFMGTANNNYRKSMNVLWPTINTHEVYNYVLYKC